MPRSWLLMSVSLLGCHPTSTARVEETRPEPPVVMSARAEPAARARVQAWEGTVRVSTDDAGAHRKVFKGVWLEAPDGTRRVLTYEDDSPFHALCDQPVRVAGELYSPPGQALVAEHLRSHELRATAAGAPLGFIGEKRTMRGHFETARPDEQAARFVEDGGASHLVQHISGQAAEPVPRCSRGAPLARPKGIPAAQPVEIEAYSVSTGDAVTQDASVWVMSWKPLNP